MMCVQQEKQIKKRGLFSIGTTLLYNHYLIGQTGHLLYWHLIEMQN